MWRRYNSFRWASASCSSWGACWLAVSAGSLRHGAAALRVLDSDFAADLHWCLIPRRPYSEELHATLRERFEADQRAAPRYRVLPTGIPQTQAMPPTTASLLFRERDYRR